MRLGEAIFCGTVGSDKTQWIQRRVPWKTSTDRALWSQVTTCSIWTVDELSWSLRHHNEHFRWDWVVESSKTDMKAVFSLLKLTSDTPSSGRIKQLWKPIFTEKDTTIFFYVERIGVDLNLVAPTDIQLCADISLTQPTDAGKCNGEYDLTANF